jgi:two-component system, chemotaxis family, CheB/CheR fusion protein
MKSKNPLTPQKPAKTASPKEKPKNLKKPKSQERPVKSTGGMEASQNELFPVAAIGASAGGLEAYEEFFSVVPDDIGMAFILIPHLDPGHVSMMSDILGRATALPVKEAEEGITVLPNHIYVIPPNKEMSITNGMLHLEPLKRIFGTRLPIDFFFRSLAADLRERAIAIILSGTGMDGTLGIRAIHESGGTVMVQTPSSAKYSGMPESAIRTGLVDYTQEPKKIALQLKEYSSKIVEKIKSPAVKVDNINQILNLVRFQTGHDLSSYKKTTLTRRVVKRKILLGISSNSAYLVYLRQHPEEVLSLFKDMLIGVTQFFRDQEAFEVLKKELKEYIKNQPEGEPFRAWVPACGTGEEVYSLVIITLECLSELKKDMKVQFFGTDIQTEAINQARSGFYSTNIGVDVNSGRLKRFFVKEENMLRIKKEVRDLIVFAPQDVAKDPPFTKLDLLSCRNLLIYLESDLQNRLLPLFHYSLKPDGILFLGTSETIGKFLDLFRITDRKWKIYHSKKVFTPAQEEAWRIFPWVTEQVRGEIQAEVRKVEEVDIPAAAKKMLLETFAPPSLVVNEKGEILYIHGQTGKYLEPVPGRPTWIAFDMAREGLQFELRSGVHYALSRLKTRRYEHLRVKTDQGTQLINLIVKPFMPSTDTKGLAAIIFEEAAEPEKRKFASKEVMSKTIKDEKLRETERELLYTRESLQATVEELQASNEELKSTNEEMQSTNEELQSTNEELETSREELQSINEELTTVNAELQGKIDLLAKAESDIKVLLENTHIGIIFLDTHFNIQRFTTEATKIFNLIPGDLGRPLPDINSNLVYDEVEKDVQKVLGNLQNIEKEVRTKRGEWYLLQIMPYRSVENTIEGVVLTMTDISELKRSDAFRAVVETVREPLVVLDESFRIILANRSFYRTFHLSKPETENVLFYQIGKGQWDIPELRKLLEDVLPRGKQFDDFVVDHDFPGLGKKRMLLNARKMVGSVGKGIPAILLALEDITDRGD